MTSFPDLPESFLQLFKETLSQESLSLFIDSFEQIPPTSVRYNPEKFTTPQSDHPVPWSRFGHYLKTRPVFSKDPLFYAGGIYVQDASSMFIEQLYNTIVLKERDAPYRVLDLCAAPGGKSTHLLSLIGKDAFLVANEVIRARVYTLSDNIKKWGCNNVIVTNNDPSDFKHLDAFFDLIVTDLPCSGEGMFRKNREAIGEWSDQAVSFCSSRQKRIISDIWDSLRPGGYMIYSTCTFNKRENDDNVNWIADELGAEVVEVDNKEDYIGMGIVSTPAGGYQFIPGAIEGEGFYCALLKKRERSNGGGSTDHDREIRSMSRINKGLDPAKLFSQPPIRGNQVYVMKKEMIKVYPSLLASEMLYVESKLKVVYSAIAVARVLNSTLLLPHPDLAMSVDLERERFVEMELDQQSAIRVIEGQTFPLTENPKGYILLKYRNIPLAIVKNLGKRFNYL